MCSRFTGPNVALPVAYLDRLLTGQALQVRAVPVTVVLIGVTTQVDEALEAGVTVKDLDLDLLLTGRAVGKDGSHDHDYDASDARSDCSVGAPDSRSAFRQARHNLAVREPVRLSQCRHSDCFT